MAETVARTVVPNADAPVVDRYLGLMKMCLTRYGLDGKWNYVVYEPGRSGLAHRLRKLLLTLVRRRGLEIVRPDPIDLEVRAIGLDWPPTAESMIGLERMDNLQFCIEDVLANDVPGDLVETGVWRGGASIFMRAVLAAHGVRDRTVWLADSFEGLPPPDPDQYPDDAGSELHEDDPLRVTIEEVENNFRKYGLLDGQVRFLKGWFKDTLPSAPIEQIAVLRLDGDMYESTIQALDALYPKLAVGGHVIVDDYGAIAGCRLAVTDFRERHGIDDEIVVIDWAGVCWRRTR